MRDTAKRHSEAENTSPLTPQQLYARCEQEERVPDRKTFERVLSLLAGHLTFRERIFAADSTLGPASSLDAPKVLNKAEAIHYAERYLQIIDLLKQCPSRGALWLVLALWLRDEGIRELSDFSQKTYI
jgi:hypothetical protein